MIEPWRDDLASFYKSFDVFLLPSNYEGWGRAVIEAMAAGLPVVMTDVGLAGEVVKNNENGIVVPVGDRVRFVSAVIALARNPALRRRIAEEAAHTVHNLRPGTWGEYHRRYQESFSSCA